VKQTIQKYPSISAIIGILTLFLAIGSAINFYREAAMQQFERRVDARFEDLQRRIESERDLVDKRIDYLERYWLQPGPRLPR